MEEEVLFFNLLINSKSLSLVIKTGVNEYQNN
jgi:hypothetical protein